MDQESEVLPQLHKKLASCHLQARLSELPLVVVAPPCCCLLRLVPNVFSCACVPFLSFSLLVLWVIQSQLCLHLRRSYRGDQPVCCREKAGPRTTWPTTG